MSEESGDVSSTVSAEGNPADENLEQFPEQLQEAIAEEGDEGDEFARAMIAMQAQRHSGPLPSPETLEKYKEISPRAADWIIEAATKEQDNRHWCDKEPLRQSRRGQTFAFSIAVLVVVIGGLLIFFEKSAEGLATILVPLVSILGVFVYKEIRTHKQRQQVESKTSEEAGEQSPQSAL